jgi:hypothetical protein
LSIRRRSCGRQITLAFLGAGVLSYIIIPGLLVIWDRILDHMGGY